MWPRLWTTFRDEDGILHVMPVLPDKRDEPEPGHDYGSCCPCGPRWDRTKEGILVHEIIQGAVQ